MNNDKIWDWISELSYDDLSEPQKKLVDAEMGEEEYEELRSSVSLFKDVDDVKWPNGKVRNIKENKPAPWWQYKMPLYQWAAASMLIGVLAFTMLDFQKDSQIEPQVRSSFTLDQDVYPDSLVVQL